MNEGELKKQEQKEQEPKPMRVFIDIGSGQNPVAATGLRKFYEDEIYIGIDRNINEIKTGKIVFEKDWHLKDVRPDSDKARAYFIQADATCLPLKDASASEIIFGNVFSSNNIKQDIKYKLIEEAKRVLADDGTIIIEDTNTPEVSFDFISKILKKDLCHYNDDSIKEILSRCLFEKPDFIGDKRVRISGISGSGTLSGDKRVR